MELLRLAAVATEKLDCLKAIAYVTFRVPELSDTDIALRGSAGQSMINVAVIRDISYCIPLLTGDTYTQAVGMQTVITRSVNGERTYNNNIRFCRLDQHVGILF